MIWKTSQGKNIPVSQMDNKHLENCIAKITENNRPSCIIYGFKAKVWVKAMSKELINREIAIVENNIVELRKRNMELKKKYDDKCKKLSELQAVNNAWDEFKFYFL